MAKLLAQTVASSGNGFTVTHILWTYLGAISRCTQKDVSPRTIFSLLPRAVDTESKQLDVELLESLLAEHSEPAARQPVMRWTFLFPVNIQVGGRKQKIKLRLVGNDYEISSDQKDRELYKSLVERSDYQIEMRTRDEKRVNKWRSFIRFSCRGDSCLAAFRSAERGLWILRGLLELTLGGGTMRHSWPARTPRMIELESWALGENEESEVGFVHFNWLKSSYSDVLDLPRAPELSAKAVWSISKLRRHLKSEQPSGLAEVLADSLCLYVNSLDQLWDSEQFIHLWQLAELVTLASRFNGNTSIVCKRFGRHFAYKGVTEEDMAKAVSSYAAIRNAMVHRADGAGIDESLVNEFRLGCANAIWWLSGRCADLETCNRLELYYSLSNSRNRQLLDYKEVAEFILENR